MRNQSSTEFSATVDPILTLFYLGGGGSRSEVGISEGNLGIFIADLPGTADAAAKSDKHKCSHPFLEQVAGRGWFKVELQGAYLAVFTGAPKPCKWRLLLKTAPIPVLSWSIFISLLLQRKPYDSLCSIFLGLCRRVFLFLAAQALLFLGTGAMTFAIKGGRLEICQKIYTT